MIFVFFFFFFKKKKNICFFFFFSSRRRHTRLTCDWSSDVCSSDLDRTCSARRSGIPTAHRRRSSTRPRSEERRVGKECRSRWSPDHEKKKKKKKDTILNEQVVMKVTTTLYSELLNE